MSRARTGIGLVSGGTEVFTSGPVENAQREREGRE